jgi:hypothetical protein
MTNLSDRRRGDRENKPDDAICSTFSLTGLPTNG